MPTIATDEPLGPVSAQQRVAEIDVLRGWALLGILLVNMSMDLPWIRLIPLRASEAWINEALYRVIDILAEGKFYILFSFLFGLGFFIQMSRAERRGAAFLPLYVRRLVGLYVIGLVLGLIAGESQLRIYATLGLLLLILRRLPQRPLLLLAFIFLLFMPVRDVLEAWQRRNEPADINAAWQQRADALAQRTVRQQESVRVHQTGTLSEITRSHLPRTFWDWSWLTGEFPFLLLGFWAGRRGIFDDVRNKHRLFKRTMWWGLAFGLLACLVAHIMFERRQLWETAPPTWGMRQVAELLDLIGSPALTFSYAAGMMLLCAHSWGRGVVSRLAPVGQMALTNYALQWLMFAFLTYSYGLALYGKFGLAVGLTFAIGLFALQLVFSRWWLKRFRFGPAEWLWRSATYLEVQPMRR